jgi:hypothetical protein
LDCLKIDASDLQSPPAVLASGWMQICCKMQSGVRWRLGRGALAAGAGASLLLFAAGCASPGPALPPSLNLPAVVTDLAVTRVGDEVRLRWTTPARTSDKLALKGPIAAEICREVSGATPRVAVGGKACLPVVVRVAVRPGASEASDTLPAGLIAGAPGVLAYRVQLRNAAGRTAGASAAVFAASGAAPGPVEGLHATAVKGGAMLEWTAGGSGDSVELDRSLVEAPVVAAAAAHSERKGAKEAAEVRLRVAGDSGGAVDRTAVVGESYRYTAQRLRTVVVGGRSLEVRSAASGSVAVAMADVFPPEAPVGLVASPGFAGAAGGGERPTIELSWEPGMEAGIAGYRVYRRVGDGDWVRLNAELVAMPAYRDVTVAAGRRYGYRVTAVDGVGNESKPGGEVVETAPGQ